MTNRILVVCYSRTGSTAHVAERLAQELSADLEQIEEATSRSGYAGYARSALEALAKGLPTIHFRRDPRDYELVVLGTPVWTGTMCSPIRSYLSSQARNLKNPAFFAVMGGRGAEQTVREMKLACAAPQAPSAVFVQRSVEQPSFRVAFDQFVSRLRVQDGRRAQGTATAA
jgi:flavodoxin